MSVITISRELGSGGGHIAQELAKASNYRLVDKAMLEKILKQFGFVQFTQDYEAASSYWDRMDETRLDMITTLNRVLQATASLGNMIMLGRGSFAVLGEYANVLNVRLQAPFAVRVKRIMAERNLTDLAKAEKIVKESDQIRASFIQSWYGLRWDVASYFNLVIDTSIVSGDTAVEWILNAREGIEKSTAEHKRSLASLVVDDAVVLRTVREMIESNAA